MEPIKESNVTFVYKESPTHPDMLEVTATLSLHYRTEIPRQSGSEYRDHSEQELRLRLENWIWGPVREAAQEVRMLALSLMPMGLLAQQQRMTRMFKRITEYGFQTRETCKHCGLKLRKLPDSDIPVHEIDSQPSCENAARTMAEWSEA